MSFAGPYLTLPNFEYHQPATLKEALSLLSEYGTDAKIMAGGVGVVNFMKERLLKPKVLVDIKKIPELQEIGYREAKGLKIGAAVTTNRVIETAIVRERYGALYEALSLLADSVLRNRITLVGNLCEAFPWIDSLPPLLVFDAEVQIVSPKASRTVKVKDFIRDVGETVLESDELVVAVDIPEPPKGARSKYVKSISRTEFGVVNIAGLVVASRSGPANVRLAYGSATPVPVVIDTRETRIGKSSNRAEFIDAVTTLAAEKVDPMTDIHGSAEYKAHLVDVLTHQMLGDLLP